VAAVVTAIAVASGGFAIPAVAAPQPGAAPPPVPRSPAVTSVAAVRSHIVIPDDPARRVFTPTATTPALAACRAVSPLDSTNDGVGRSVSARTDVVALLHPAHGQRPERRRVGGDHGSR
jgi:hypothetical protein